MDSNTPVQQTIIHRRSCVNSIIEYLTHIYSRLLLLYPRRFQDEFAEEMQVVFRDSLNEAVKDGILSVTILRLREMGNLPASIFWEFWRELERRDVNLTTTTPSTPRRDRISGSWKDAFMAGLPHLMVATFIGINKLYQSPAMQPAMSLILGLPLLVGLISTAIYARKLKWPLWSASWYGYWTWLGIIALGVVCRTFNTIFNLFVDWKFNNTISLIAVILPVIGLFWLFRKSRIKAILSVFFLMPILFPLMMLEFVPDYIEALLAFASGLIAALSAALIVRWGDWRAATGLALGANLIMGISYAYVEAYKLEIPQNIIYPVKPAELLSYLTLFMIISIIVILGPLIFWRIWDFGKRALRT